MSKDWLRECPEEKIQEEQAKSITKENLRNAIMTIRNYCRYCTGNDCDEDCWLYSDKGSSVCKLLRFAPLRWSKNFVPEDIPEEGVKLNEFFKEDLNEGNS